jgi:hypothetical protein
MVHAFRVLEDRGVAAVAAWLKTAAMSSSADLK